MNFHSTIGKTINISFKEAVLKSLAEDGGLYVPAEIPKIDKAFFDNFDNKTFFQITREVSEYYINQKEIRRDLDLIIKEAFDFPIKLKKLENNLYCLELFHGPTLAFKDFGARFMARVMSRLARGEKRKLTILVATSGDTGGAVGNAFLGVPNTQVVILFPKGGVSFEQEKQLTTMGKNVKVLEVSGSFDDCQRMVKKAFRDKELNKKLLLTSANSINFARLLPQSFYYYFAKSRLENSGNVVFSVPSGNFGNLTAGVMAKKTGLKKIRFIAANNANDTFYKYIKSGKYIAQKSKKTISNAMDIGDPSNIKRLNYFYSNDLNAIKKDISAFTFSDSKTKEAILEVYKKYNYIIDPHTAVAYLGAKQEMIQASSKKDVYVFLSTAHPAKFRKTVEKILKRKIEIPEKFKEIFKKEKKSQDIDNNYLVFKKYLTKNI